MKAVNKNETAVLSIKASLGEEMGDVLMCWANSNLLNSGTCVEWNMGKTKFDYRKLKCF